jgi:RNA polymerase sigma-70 factor (ECF subfamily)
MSMSHQNMTNQFLAIYNAESDAIFRYCLLRTSSRDVSLDLSQEAFMRFWKMMSQKKEISNHRALLFTITRNLIIDWYRKKKTLSIESLDQEFGDNSDKSVADKFVLDNTTQEALELNADGRYLLGKIKELDEPYEQVVFMRIVLDLGPKEISQILGESENVISVRISRGLEKMKKKFVDKKQ